MSPHCHKVVGTDLECVTFHWSRHHGDCCDCGAPAAFFVPLAPDEARRRKFANPLPGLCAVCAANHAADGETISRIAP